MKRVRAYHPILFALFPVLYLYSRNMALLPSSDVLHPALLVIGGTVTVWLVLWAILRDSNRAASVVTVLALLAFSFGPFCSAVKTHLNPAEGEGLRGAILPYWLGAMALFGAVAAWKGKLKPAAISFLNMTGAVLIATTLGSIVQGAFRLNKDIAAVTPGGALSSSGSASTRPPDIYYIILDGCGRTDALEEFLGFSNQDFTAALEKRGFYVAKGSHSNYSQTEQSLASSLNMQLLPELVGGVDSSSSDRAPLDHLIDRNAVARFLRTKGYGYVSVTTGFPSVTGASADLQFSGKSAVNLLEATLVSNTPLDLNQGEITSQYNVRREGLLSAFENLASLGRGGTRPRFIFAHILAPHPPFVFGENGEARTPKGSFGYWDGSDFMEHIGTPDDYKTGYRDQLIFVQKKVLGAVDSILAHSKTQPVILIQGDHGSKLRLDQGSLDRTDVRECFRNLSCYLVPPAVRQRLYPTITPVNSFRVLFDSLFGADMPLLPDASYYSTFPEPYRYVDVTAKIEDAKPTPAKTARVAPKEHSTRNGVAGGHA